MDEKTTEEIIRTIENANSGNWMPLTVVAGVFGIVVVLLVYIWKQKMKEDERRHDANERILTQLTENERVANATLAELKMLTASNKERLDNIGA